MEGTGAICFWGLTPQMDLLDPIRKSNIELFDEKEVNILLVGGTDLRHVLKTLHNAVNDERMKNKKIRFFMHEGQPEVIARNLVLLKILMDESLGLAEKIELFLDAFGNLMVRERTAEIIQSKAKELIRLMVHEVKGTHEDFSWLQYKERDLLEMLWKKYSPSSPFDAKKLWNERLRRFYGVRYDVRYNVADWDHSMKLRDFAPIVHRTHFQYWREHGLAFATREIESYCHPNWTLRSYSSRVKHGEDYYGDIVHSPYLAMGIEAPNADLFETRQGQHVKTSIDVTEFNLSEQIPSLAKISFEIVPLLGAPEKWFSKAKMSRLFDVMYFGWHRVHLIDTQFNASQTLRTEHPGIVILEMSKYMIELRKEHVTEFRKRVEKFCDDNGWHSFESSSTPDSDDEPVFITKTTERVKAIEDKGKAEGIKSESIVDTQRIAAEEEEDGKGKEEAKEIVPQVLEQEREQSKIKKTHWKEETGHEVETKRVDVQGGFSVIGPSQ